MIVSPSKSRLPSSSRLPSRTSRLRGCSLHPITIALAILPTLLPPFLQGADDLRLSDPVKVSGQQPYKFGNVLMGGVEQVTGMVWCASKPQNAFIRADGGGIWRLDRQTAGDRWVSLTDNLPYKWRDLVTVDSIAVHPSDPQIIYIACGTRGGELHDILKTENGGATWKRLFVTGPGGKPVASDGNGENKQAGERLVIDPNAPETLYFATRNDGLLRSKDAGKTWQPIASLPSKGKAWAGLSFVLLDPRSGGNGEPSKRIYVAAQPDRPRSVRGGLYVSDDAGATWTRIDEGPGMQPMTTTFMRARISSDGTLYVTTIGMGIWKYRGAWTDITPTQARSKPLCGVNLHPTDANKLLVAETGVQSESVFYYSSDAGANWKRYAYVRSNRSRGNARLVDVPAWLGADQDAEWGSNASDVAFDGVNPQRVWHLSSSGACIVDGVGGDEVSVSLSGGGREQITCEEAVCPTAGAPVISGVWDFGGFRHASLGEIPTSRLKRLDKGGLAHPEAWKRYYQNVFDIDVQPGRPNRLVLCGGWQWNQTGEAAYSTDNGMTFREFPTKPFDAAKFGRIALGVDPNHVVWAPLGNALTSVFYTRDNGQTWSPSDGAPPGMISTEGVWSFYRCLAADRVRADTFYLYDRRDGRFYRSEDGGERFRQVASLPRQAGVHSDWHRLEPTPWREGDLWLALREQGLLHSTDGGNTWTKLQGIEWAQNLCLGLPRKQGEYPTMFLFGQIGGEKPSSTTVDARLYRSDDGGMTWAQLNDESTQFACIAAGFAGDMQKFGRVYITTSSRGMFYGEPSDAK